MSQPVRRDLDMTSGADATFEFELTDGRGTALDLDGHTVEMFVAYSYGKTAYAKIISSPHYDADNGLVRFTLTRSIIGNNIAPETRWYEVWRTSPGGERKPHFCGELQLNGTSRF